MKRKYVFELLLVFFVTVTFVGCNHVAAPEDYPRIYPSHVKILKDGEPLKDIQVILMPENQTLSYIIAGKTDKGGIAEIRTIRGSYEKPGAPEGNYRVKLHEYIPVEMPSLGETPTAKQQRTWNEEYARKIASVRKIPEILCDTAKTPLTFFVNQSGSTLEIDVSQHQ